MGESVYVCRFRILFELGRFLKGGSPREFTDVVISPSFWFIRISSVETPYVNLRIKIK